MSLVGASVVRYALPYASPTAGLTSRSGLWLRLVDAEGRVGLGDAAPWPGTEALDTVEVTLRGAAAELLESRGAPTWRSLAMADGPARFALESALLSLESQRTGRPLADLIALALADAGYARPTSSAPLAVSALVNDVAGALAAVAAGYRTLKVKFDGRDLRLVAAVRAAVPADVALRVDANGRGDATRTPVLLAELAALGVTLIEEPAGLPTLALTTPRPATFADESVRTVAELEASPADGVVLKPGFTGLRAAIALAARAQRLGRRMLVTHVLESAVGREVAAAFAAALGARADADGLAPPVWVDEVTEAPSTVPPAPSEPQSALDLPDPVRGSALARPNHPAVEAGDITWTWRTLDDVAGRLATLFQRLGIAPGDRVATVAPLSLRTVALLHGLRRVGAVAIPVAPERAESAALVGTWGLHPGAAPPRPWVALSDDATEPGGLSLPPAPEPFHPPDADAFAILTSGTTGEPRLVALGVTQMTLSAFASSIRLGHVASDRWLLPLPLHHIGGLMVLVRSALIGTTVRLEDGGPDALATSLRSGDVTLVSLVPAQLQRLIADGRSPFAPKVRAVLVGGAPMPPSVLAQARELGIPLALSWGMTETSSQVATQHPGAPASLAAPPLAFARITDDAEGRLHVYGPQARGHVATRDLGHVGEEGVRVTGRLDDTFISGGVNVDPAEVEAVLRRHPAIADVMVVGVPDATFGERAGALYVPTRDLDGLEATLAAWARAELPPASRPVRWQAVSALPLTPLGKPARSVAQALLAPSLLSTSAHAAPHASPNRDA